MINEYNEGAGYKRIFECAKNEGIEETLNLFRQMEELQKIDLTRWAIIGGVHHTLSLTKKYKGVIKYLREYKKDLQSIIFSNENLIKSLEIAKNNPKILETYIENMRMLEELKIDRVEIVELRNLLNRYYYLEIHRLSQTRAKVTQKYYTDGKIELDDHNTKINEHIIRRLFEISNKSTEEQTTFLINVSNNNHRNIEITGFDFNSEYLPSEEELSSCDIPYALKLNK